MRYADSVQEAVEQLKEAQDTFLATRMEDAWVIFRKKCQQLSQWIEHGRGVTDEMKPELVKTLFAAEKVLLDNRGKW
jgi:uncharacterized protein Yka (UPF0111/DUF47 family)